jgi:hypothetical protein
MMVAVAIAGLVLFVVQEFWDGLPPRFVVRDIPDRIGRLRLGMTWDQAHETLGLEKSWLRGGTSAQPWILEGNGHYMHAMYTVGAPRTFVKTARVAGGASAPVTFIGSQALIQLHFATDIDGDLVNWQRDKSTQLIRAWFSRGFTTIAEMPTAQ